MKYSDELSAALRDHFQRLPQKERPAFAAAEAAKFGVNGVRIAATILDCHQDLIQKGRLEAADRYIREVSELLDEEFGSGDAQTADSWEDQSRGIPAFAALLKKYLRTTNIRQLGKHVNSTRAVLNRSPYWPTSVKRARNICIDTFNFFSRYIDIRNKAYLDFGCGNAQPFGTSALMYLNGASSTVALDIDHTAHTRAAVSLYDILMDCLSFPDDWHFSKIDRADFLNRLRQFDLRALQVGNLREGIKKIPLRHIVSDVCDCDDLDGQIDIVSSRVVLEHVMEFDEANGKVFNMLKPGGVACHKIGMHDHRRGPGMHAFSFLAEEHWNSTTNRLRSSEIRTCFEKIGYEIIMYEETRQSMPPGFENLLATKYRAMDKADLEVTEVNCVLRRPK